MPMTSNALRIAHITATFPPYRGGTGHVCYQNALHLARRGHQVTVFTAAPDQITRSPDEMDALEFEVCRLKPLLRIGNAPLLPGLVRLRGFDLIHLHWPFIFGAELTWLTALSRRIPVVITYHNDLIGDGARRALFQAYQAVAARLILFRASRVMPVSLDYAEHCQLAPLFRQAGRRVVEMSNGVDTSIFQPGDRRSVRDRFGIAPDAPVILFVGALDRAHHFKGVDTLLQAFAQLERFEPRLLIAGDGDTRADYEAQARALGIADRVIFAGSIPHQALPPFYAACDVLALPSSPPESFGLVLVEALACGRPVIASNIPGVRSVVRNGEDGWLIPPGDDRALTLAMQTALSDPARLTAMGEKGRTRVAAQYEWSALAAHLEQVYLDIIPHEHQP
jgi:glycosyltransferase involved in cell wall biosynthesis